jgi:hypothetical protein
MADMNPPFRKKMEKIGNPWADTKLAQHTQKEQAVCEARFFGAMRDCALLIA